MASVCPCLCVPLSVAAPVCAASVGVGFPERPGMKVEGIRVEGIRVDWKTWRRPTLPCLEAQYHGRWGFSRPSSGWDRVRSPRQSHQVVQPVPAWDGRATGFGAVCAGCGLCWGLCVGGSSGDDSRTWGCGRWYVTRGRCSRACRAIRTGQLRALPRVHTRPIDVMVYHGPPGLRLGDLVLRGVSRLDAFSGYLVHT